MERVSFQLTESLSQGSHQFVAYLHTGIHLDSREEREPDWLWMIVQVILSLSGPGIPQCGWPRGDWPGQADLSIMETPRVKLLFHSPEREYLETECVVSLGYFYSFLFSHSLRSLLNAVSSCTSTSVAEGSINFMASRIIFFCRRVSGRIKPTRVQQFPF